MNAAVVWILVSFSYTMPSMPVARFALEVDCRANADYLDKLSINTSRRHVCLQVREPK